MYFSHKKYRVPSPQYSKQYRDFLNQHPIVVPTPGPSRRFTEHSEVSDNIESRHRQ